MRFVSVNTMSFKSLYGCLSGTSLFAEFNPGYAEMSSARDGNYRKDARGELRARTSLVSPTIFCGLNR
jgi:hypothetical protein